MSHQTIDYEEMLRSAGYRVTNQRIYILDAVCAANGHTTLGEIYARLHKIDQSIDRSTLYRTLKLFVKLGLVVSADTGAGEVTYEITKPQQHHHLVCRNCGNQQEIDSAVFQTMRDAVFDRYQFHVETDHLILFGICANCRSLELQGENSTA